LIKIIKLIIPKIFFIDIFNVILNKIFISRIKYENNFYNRVAFINKAISKYKNCKYLEIGVADNYVFNSIPLKTNNKFGVDPNEGGNLKMTSDLFFKKYHHLKFDVIFIDGYHSYQQVQRDVLNSIKQLKKNGIIFIHDMLPRNYLEEKYPRPKNQHVWMGDVWKVGVELNNCKNKLFKIINIDCGIGILKVRKNFKYNKMPLLKKMGFKEFMKFYKKMPLINSKEALHII
jgi:hypothetical protein